MDCKATKLADKYKNLCEIIINLYNLVILSLFINSFSEHEQR